MRKLFCIVLLLVFIQSYAQNLVTNPSFEIIVNCPTQDGLGNLAQGWEMPTGGTADLFNSCAGISCPLIPPYICVPENWVGTELPHSGNSYTGFFSHWAPIGTNYREYLHSKLNEKLKKNETYLITFFVSLGDDSQYASDGIGIYFSEDSIWQVGGFVLNYSPQFEIVSPITEKNGWTKVCGYYKASGNENYITIGNFNDDLQTTFQNVPGGLTGHNYYYIDDIEIIKSEILSIQGESELCIDSTLLLTINDTNIQNFFWQDSSTNNFFEINNEGEYWIEINNSECKYRDYIQISEYDCLINLEIPNVFSPNNDGINDKFHPIKFTNLFNVEFYVMNRWGQKIHYEYGEINGWDGRYLGEPCSDGVYYWIINYTDLKGNELIANGFFHLVQNGF